MKQKKIDYPILFDCGGRMFKELGLRGYPTAILIGRDGKVIWEDVLSGAKARKTVQELIDRRASRKPGPK